MESLFKGDEALAILSTLNNCALESNIHMSSLSEYQRRADSALNLVAQTESKLLAVNNAASSLKIVMEHCLSPAERVAGIIESAQKSVSRSNSVYGFAETVSILKNAISDIYSNMAIKDWESAARAASVALSIPEEIRSSQFACQMVPSAELPETPDISINNACKEMAELFTREFEIATKQNDAAKITHNFKLLPLVGCKEQGLRLYSRYIRNAVSVQSRQLIRGGISQGGEYAGHSIVFGIAMARLFESIAIILEQHTQLITRHYGENAMVQVIQEIQSEIDAQAGLIVDTWWDERRLDRCLAEVKFYSYPILAAALSSVTLKPDNELESPVLDLNEVAKLLNELAMMLNRWNLYCDFVSNRWSAESIIKSSQFCQKIAEMLDSAFSTMSIFVLRRTVEKAIEMDESPLLLDDTVPETAPVSSMADDVLFVFNNLFSQTCESGNLHILNSVIPSFQRIIESDFCSVVQHRLREITPSQLRMAAPNSKATLYLILINNLIYLKESISAIVSRTKVGDEVTKEYPVCLMNLSIKMELMISKKADLIAKEHAKVLFSTVILPQLKNLCSQLLPHAYIMSPAEPESLLGDRFDTQWSMVMREAKKHAHSEVYNQLASLAASSLATLIDRHIWTLKGKVNELGAIALDRDVSRIMSVVSETDYGLREKFVRVAQIVMIICEEDGNDAADYSELSQADIAAARQIRMDPTR